MERSLEDAFKPFLNNPTFQEILNLVRQNSKGKIWVIGGFVYRNLVAALYGGEIYDYDIDFIVDEKNEVLKEVLGWRIEFNSYGNPNYVCDSNKMSFTDIHKAIRVLGMPSPTIDDFLKGTPLNVQSIAYDIIENKMIGEIGKAAIARRELAVNDFAQANFYANRKKKKLEEILREKANELGFGLVS
jgi:hypothetical protein